MMDFNELHERTGLARTELEQIKENILALAQFESRRYTWEEKIESLVKLAKAAGRYINDETEHGTDYAEDARRRLLEAYEEFCHWRHDEPYVVDEIKGLLAQSPVEDLIPPTDVVARNKAPDPGGKLLRERVENEHR